MRTLTGRALLAGVVGWPVAHSRSPRLHGFWLDEHKIDGAYLPLAVRPENLATVLRALPLLGFRGVNLTVPHKETALAVVDWASDAARRIGAVNTIVIDADGRLEGSNTDGFGFLENLAAALPRWRASDGAAVLLGAGGAARAIAAALADGGAPEIRLVNRTPERARVPTMTAGCPLIRARGSGGAAVVRRMAATSRRICSTSCSAPAKAHPWNCTRSRPGCRR